MSELDATRVLPNAQPAKPPHRSAPARYCLASPHRQGAPECRLTDNAQRRSLMQRCSLRGNRD
jgi:hypothetical protein